MSIFGDILSAIFESSHASDVLQPKPASQAPKQADATPPAAPRPPATATPATPGETAITHEDIHSILHRMEDDQDEELDWRHSIVDLMKLLNLDSSLRAREHLAHELGYPGTPDGSAKMNMWLHAEVMKR